MGKPRHAERPLGNATLAGHGPYDSLEAENSSLSIPCRRYERRKRRVWPRGPENGQEIRSLQLIARRSKCHPASSRRSGSANANLDRASPGIMALVWMRATARNGPEQKGRISTRTTSSDRPTLEHCRHQGAQISRKRYARATPMSRPTFSLGTTPANNRTIGDLIANRSVAGLSNQAGTQIVCSPIRRHLSHSQRFLVAAPGRAECQEPLLAKTEAK
jgi:hypothetical protein